MLSSIKKFLNKGNIPFYNLTSQDVMGKKFHFSSLKGMKVLVVNTASGCGLTPQYELLEKLYQNYKNQKFTIIAFPSNDFGNQEPLNDVEINTFCHKNYNITFPIMQKTLVIGQNAHPLYKWIKKEKNISPEWNFHKFLFDEKGFLLENFEPGTSPLDTAITSLL